jgi:Beta-ketoacyl synthase, N-terminal domain
MSAALGAYIEGIGLCGPGLNDWEGGAAVLSGRQAWNRAATVIPALQCLPSAERRRTGTPVRLALTVGLEATRRANIDPAILPAVFSSSGGDGQTCHEICETLASSERQVSPTRFHNSVHNAAAGYWGIATGATPPSNALCAFDASFGAGLLEALTQVVVDNSRVLLVAYETSYPAPMRAARYIPDSFAVALVLAPERSAGALAHVTAQLSDAPASIVADAGLEALRLAIPAARSLPLLRLLACAHSGSVTLDYLPPHRLGVELNWCR